MTVAILDPGPIGILLAALLHLKGTRVSLRPQRLPTGRIRVNLPGGRLIVEGVGRAAASDGPCLLVTEDAGRGFPVPADAAAASGHGLIVHGGAGGPERSPGGLEGWESCLLLGDAVMLDGACVEIPGPEMAIVARRGGQAASVLAGLSSFGFAVQERDDVDACVDSFRVLRLLDLPVAMCNTTRGHFLSSTAGRRIACGVLEEGRRTYEKLGRRLGRLPAGDPIQLLGRLRRFPRSFDASRYLPDRAFSPTLQDLMRGGVLDPKGCNRRLVERAAGTGLTLEWNWKLAQKVSRIRGAGYFTDPEELLAAIR